MRAALAKIPLLAMGALLAAAPAPGQPPSPQSGTYKVEPNHTMVVFSVNHHGFTTYYGRFTNASGSLKLDSGNPAASTVEVSVPVAGEITPSPALNQRIMGTQLLDAARYPAMNFHSTRIVRTGAKTADITGDLTIHGVTRPVTLKAILHGFGVQPMEHDTVVVGFDATGEIKRSDFGVGFGVPIVSDEVELILSAQFDLVAP